MRRLFLWLALVFLVVSAVVSLAGCGSAPQSSTAGSDPIPQADQTAPSLSSLSTTTSSGLIIQAKRETYSSYRNFFKLMGREA